MTERFNSLRAGSDGRSVHDVGGLAFGPIDREEHDLALWEKRVDAMMRALGSPTKRAFTVDAMRRMIESYSEQQYDATDYYEKWVRALRNLLLEQEIFTAAELDAKIDNVRAAFIAEGRGASHEAVPHDTGKGVAP
ncbi:MAG: ScnB-like protein [Pseudomonadota bacterium]